MPALALKHSVGRNAVSELHGRVTRKMWSYLWPDLPEDEVPITHITNGVHVGTWLARRLHLLYDRYLGVDWLEQADNPDIWELVTNIPDEQLWSVRTHLKRKLAAYVRERARLRWLRGAQCRLAPASYRSIRSRLASRRLLPTACQPDLTRSELPVEDHVLDRCRLFLPANRIPTTRAGRC
jgi:glucan phosphorylase